MRKYLFLLFLCFALTGWAQTYQRLTNLPHVIIDTYNGADITSKTTYVLATMHYVDEQDSVAVYDSMQIRGRGNSTWNLSKKPYRIKFNKKEKLLGKGYANAKSWTLLANAADKSLLRNALTSRLGDYLGMKNNPAHKFCDLTLNGTYVGTYQISDQVEVRPHRVNIKEQDYPLADTSNITGGYLLEIDGFKDGICVYTTKNIPIRIHYPDEDEIATTQKTYIKNYLNDFESRLFGTDFKDALKGYRPMVDSVTLANWFLSTEISANVDGHYSTYFYKEQDDSCLHWGPLWDYDIAYNNDYRISDTRQLLMADDGFGSELGKVWMKQMMKDLWFCQLINRRFLQAYQSGIENSLILEIDSLSALLQDSQELNYERWGINNRAYHEIVLYSSYQQYVDDIKEFIHTHLAYLSTALAQKVKDATPGEPEPTPDPTELDSRHWYRISNVISDKSFILNSSNKVVLCTSSSSDSTQLWRIHPVGDYYMLISYKDGLALNDPTEGNPTATTLVGTQLNGAEQDSTDDRQLWTLTPQDNGSTFNLVNLFSGHTANLSNGNTGDGTKILSYTTNEKNATSTNRRWKFTAEAEYEEPAPTTGINEPEPDDYALAYNPTTHTLHFGSATPEALTFNVEVYATNGQRVRRFLANEQCSMHGLSKGVYVIRWTVGGKTRSTKLLLTQ